MTTVFVLEYHHQLLEIWRSRAVSGIRLDHVDFHCDMRGLFVDRGRSEVAWVGREPRGLDEGNFISHAIMEGWVGDIAWVYGTPGGRTHDVSGVVLESDLGRHLPWKQPRPASRREGVAYSETRLENWAGPRQRGWLDIDWDTFASLDIPIASIEARVESFLTLLRAGGGARPDAISVCYSPGYSHPTRPAFEVFVRELANLYRAETSRPDWKDEAGRQPSGLKLLIPGSVRTVLRESSDHMNRSLRRRGIFL
ncbi:MAG: hypothetical protein AAF441_15895 [Pseudomonadota bacterium]